MDISEVRGSLFRWCMANPARKVLRQGKGEVNDGGTRLYLGSQSFIIAVVDDDPAVPGCPPFGTTLSSEICMYSRIWSSDRRGYRSWVPV